jgi:hypothetical protein
MLRFNKKRFDSDIEVKMLSQGHGLDDSKSHMLMVKIRKLKRYYCMTIRFYIVILIIVIIPL